MARCTELADDERVQRRAQRRAPPPRPPGRHRGPVPARSHRVCSGTPPAAPRAPVRPPGGRGTPGAGAGGGHRRSCHVVVLAIVKLPQATPPVGPPCDWSTSASGRRGVAGGCSPGAGDLADADQQLRVARAADQFPDDVAAVARVRSSGSACRWPGPPWSPPEARRRAPPRSPAHPAGIPVGGQHRDDGLVAVTSGRRSGCSGRESPVRYRLVRVRCRRPALLWGMPSAVPKGAVHQCNSA